MLVEKEIDHLIEAGWRVLRSDFNEVVFGEWRKEALSCLTTLCGSEHAYTEYFRNKIRKAAVGNVLTGVGVLTAAGMQSEQGVVMHRDQPSLDSMMETTRSRFIRNGFRCLEE